MTSRSASSFAIVAAAAAIAVPCAFPSTLQAQELALWRAVVANGFTLHTEGPGLPTALGGLPAGTDVTAGLLAQCSGPTGMANAYGSFELQDQSLLFELMASCVTSLNVPGASSGTGRPSVVAVLTVPQPMTVRFTARAVAIVGPGTPPCRGVVDVGADGLPELDFVSPVGTCSVGEQTVVLALPAGRLAIRLAVDVELPASAGTGGQFASMRAQLLVEPAHATVTTEDASCAISTGAYATPMLDGTNVRFYVYQSGWSLGGWLVLGSSRAQTLLPHTPWCSLLVTPDVVLPTSPATYTLLPLGLLGPGELFAQGVAMQGPSPGQPTSLLLTSPRLRLQLQ